MTRPDTRPEAPLPPHGPSDGPPHDQPPGQAAEDQPQEQPQGQPKGQGQAEGQSQPQAEVLGQPADQPQDRAQETAGGPPQISAVVAIMDDCPELAEIIQQYGREFDDRGVTWEFVLVLDGLGEERTQVVRDALPAGAPVRLVHFNQPFGEERALAVGYRTAQGEFIVSLPSYMQLDPGDVHHVLDALASGYDLVAGWRVPRVDPLTNRFQSWVYNRAMSAMTGVRLHDLNCGLTGLRKRVVEEVLVEGNVSRFLPVLAHRQGFKVGEVRVRHLREKGRSGFFGLGVYVRRVLDVVALLFITRFTRKPLRFFGMAGGLCVLAGSAVCVYLGLDYALDLSDQGDPRNRAALVVGMSLIVLGVQIFALGLVGEIIIFTSAHNVRDYTLEHEREPGREGGGGGGGSGARDGDGLA